MLTCVRVVLVGLSFHSNKALAKTEAFVDEDRCVVCFLTQKTQDLLSPSFGVGWTSEASLNPQAVQAT